MESHHHRQYPPRPGPVGLRPRRPALQAMRDADRVGSWWRPRHVLVPGLPDLTNAPRLRFVTNFGRIPSETVVSTLVSTVRQRQPDDLADHRGELPRQRACVVWNAVA